MTKDNAVWRKGDVAFVHTNNDYGTVGDIFTVGKTPPPTSDWLHHGGHGGYGSRGQTRQEFCTRIGHHEADEYRDALGTLGEVEAKIAALRCIFTTGSHESNTSA